MGIVKIRLFMSIQLGINNKKIIFWKKIGNNIFHRNHDWFDQIQRQLHVAKRETCILRVWVSNEIKIEYIKKDDDFWAEKMEAKLKDFILKCLLSDIVDSRRTRSMPIRSIVLL